MFDKIMILITKAFSILNSVLVAFMGAVFIAVSALCVVELSSRISAKAFVFEKIDRVEKILASPDAERSQDQVDAIGVSKSGQYIEEIQSLRVILDDLEHLNVTGAEGPRQTVHAIRQRISERSLAETVRRENQTKRSQVTNLEDELGPLQRLASDQAKEMAGLIARYEAESGSGPVAREIDAQAITLRSSMAETDESISRLSERISSLRNEIAQRELRVTDWSPTLFVQLNPLLYLSSDLVLAISVVLCGGIGAIFSATRSRSPRFAKSIFNGLMAGFVAFLVIKGGRFLFLIEASADSSVSINPYAAAFAGILSGLFTEKAYRVLSDVADKVGERVINAESKSP